MPSCAIDLAAHPIDWDDRERNTLFAGFVRGTVRQLEVDLTWGGDWDRDHQVGDNGFDNLFETEAEKAAAKVKLMQQQGAVAVFEAGPRACYNTLSDGPEA